MVFRDVTNKEKVHSSSSHLHNLPAGKIHKENDHGLSVLFNIKAFLVVFVTECHI